MHDLEKLRSAVLDAHTTCSASKGVVDACEQAIQDAHAAVAKCSEATIRTRELREKSRILVMAARAVRVNLEHILKECKACGRKYKASQWFGLPLAGYTTHPKYGAESRHCECGSTIMIVTRKET